MFPEYLHLPIVIQYILTQSRCCTLLIDCHIQICQSTVHYIILDIYFYDHIAIRELQLSALYRIIRKDHAL